MVSAEQPVMMSAADVITQAQKVVIRGLLGEVQLNGKRCRLLRWNRRSCCYRVLVEDMQPIRIIEIKAENLDFQVNDRLSESDDAYDEYEEIE